jgi:hypothetical protein
MDAVSLLCIVRSDIGGAYRTWKESRTSCDVSSSMEGKDVKTESRRKQIMTDVVRQGVSESPYARTCAIVLAESSVRRADGRAYKGGCLWEQEIRGQNTRE